jgi:hypothetical protein
MAGHEPLTTRLLCCLVVVLAMRTSHAEPVETTDPWSLAFQARFLAILEGVDLSATKPEDLPAERAYLIALSLVRVHRFEEAKPYLLSLKKRSYVAPQGWQTVASLLLRVVRCEVLRPPLRLVHPPPPERPVIRLFADPGPWGEEVRKDVPALVAAAREAFPDRLPTTDFYLFRERKAYERFFTNLFGTDGIRSWQHGTGRVNAVVFCAEDQNGLAHAGLARARLPGDLLHEYAHALCEERFGDLYLYQVPQWLNEGLADAIAWSRYGTMHADSPRVVQTAYASRPPATYDEMSKQLYEADQHVRYSLAWLMVSRLLSHRGNEAIAPLLDEARRVEDFEAAMKTVCGATGADVRSRVLEKLEIRDAETVPR